MSNNAQMTQKDKWLYSIARAVAPMAHELAVAREEKQTIRKQKSVEYQDEHGESMSGEQTKRIKHPVELVLKDALSAVDGAFNQPAENTSGNIAHWYVSERVIATLLQQEEYQGTSKETFIREMIKNKRERNREAMSAELEFTEYSAHVGKKEGQNEKHPFMIEHMYPRTLFVDNVVSINQDDTNLDDNVYKTKEELDKIGLAWITQEEHDVLSKFKTNNGLDFNAKGTSYKSQRNVEDSSGKRTKFDLEAVKAVYANADKAITENDEPLQSEYNDITVHPGIMLYDENGKLVNLEMRKA